MQLHCHLSLHCQILLRLRRLSLHCELFLRLSRLNLLLFLNKNNKVARTILIQASPLSPEPPLRDLPALETPEPPLRDLPALEPPEPFVIFE